MAEFLIYVRTRRAQLLKELDALEAAERLYLESQKEKSSTSNSWVPTVPKQISFPLEAQGSQKEMTIKQMIVRLLEEEYPGGLTALEVLDQIQRRWKPTLMRTSLSPQLSRLSRGSIITNVNGKWFLEGDTEDEEQNTEIQKETGTPENWGSGDW